LWSSSRAGFLQKRRIFWGLGLRFGCRFIFTCWFLSEWMARRGSRWRDGIFIALWDYLINVTLSQASRNSGLFRIWWLQYKLERAVII
jgi:hypothetical protein